MMVRQKLKKNLSFLARHNGFKFGSYKKTGIYVKDYPFTFQKIEKSFLDQKWLLFQKLIFFPNFVMTSSRNYGN